MRLETTLIRLEDTSGGAVSAAIASERHRKGSPTTGMVLTLLVISDEEFQSDATSAGVAAARQQVGLALCGAHEQRRPVEGGGSLVQQDGCVADELNSCQGDSASACCAGTRFDADDLVGCGR